MLKKILFTVLAVLLFQPEILRAQVTSSCFDIEGILVDACGNDEGNNEMVRFLVGPAPLNTGDLQVTWATVSNPWGGVCQNSSTAQKVAQLNSTIQACGYLKEPIGGVLPAKSKVLLISGFDFEPSNNSFAGLTDTVYIIFNCAAPGTGNFANSGSGIRTLLMSFSNPQNCADQVDYDRSKLIGGNGAAVSYNADGTPNYFNNGCSVPFAPLSAEWTSPGTVCAAVNLALLVTGTSGGTFSGQGVSGNTFDPAGLSGSVNITYTVGNGTCSVNTTKQITVSNAGSAEWTSPGNICSGASSLNLNKLITGAKGGIWSGNGVTDSIFNPAGLQGSIEITYTIGTGACQSFSKQSITVKVSPPLISNVNGKKEYCGETISPLTVEPLQGAEVRWYGDSLLTDGLLKGNSFKPDSGITRTYYVTQVLNDCAAPPFPVKVTFNPVPGIPEAADTVSYCAGSALPAITAAGSGTLTWYADSTLSNQLAQGPNFQPSNASIKVYYVTNTTGSCESAAKKIRLEQTPLISASIQPEGPLYLCAAEVIQLASTASTGNYWSTGDSTAAITIQNAGVYYLKVIGICNTVYDTVQVFKDSVKAGFQVLPTQGDAPLIVTVTSQSSNDTAITYLLNGNPAELQDNKITLQEEGKYTITQIVTGTGGCADTLSIEVTVSGKLSVEVPNSFTPNGDGYNEWFTIKGTGVKELECTIFNRWGSRIKELSETADSWDGTFSGTAASAGVYYYVLKAKGSGQQVFEKHGFITLIR
jgi:gliding motility-associated-like protein